jgi:rSAM/selenodomain-associated transferase 2
MTWPYTMKISVLIPTLNEVDRIGEVARHVAAVLPGHEVIVIDGGSSDRTAEAAAAPATVLRSRASRGASLNDGARLARGDVLLFLHADTTLPPNTFEEIGRALFDARVVGGAFRFSFDTRCAMARAIASWVNFRSRVFNFFLGDQALFVRKDVFLLAGGFRDWNLMEDVEILGRLRRFGRLRLTRATIATSARRHLRNGWLRTTGTVWLVTWLYFFGVPTRTLTTLYRRARTTT